jgi:hypothetical protein
LGYSAVNRFFYDDLLIGVDRLFHAASQAFFCQVAWFICHVMDEDHDAPPYSGCFMPCLGWFVDRFDRLREAIFGAYYIEYMRFFIIGRMFFLGLVDCMECLIDGSGDTSI